MTNYEDIAERFDPALAAVAMALDRSRLEWFVIAGWALDLYLDIKTREHKDLEISLWRDQADQLFAEFGTYRIDQIVGHKRYQSIIECTAVDSRGHLIVRNGATVGQKAIDIELLLSNRSNGVWCFRKEPKITLNLDDAIVRAPCGLRILAPHLVLLFKAWFFPNMDKAIQEAPQDADFFRKCWQDDCKDFAAVHPVLSEFQSKTLEIWLREYTPGIPWLASF